MLTKLGILAGGGALPASIIDACRSINREVFVIAFEGHTDQKTCANIPHKWMSLGKVNAIIKQLKNEKCQEVVLVGQIRRPSLGDLKLDMRGIKILGNLRKKINQGDNAILSLVVKELEAEGISVVAVDDILPDVTALSGHISENIPDSRDHADIKLGCKVAMQLGTLDIGQSVIVQDGVVLGVEAVEGTDALIRRCKALKGQGKAKLQGGVLIKIKKPEQERRADLPTIGLNTIRNSADAQLNGIAIQAAETLIVDPVKVVAEANKLQLFLFGMRF